jgi:DnaK suppressor protein
MAKITSKKTADTVANEATTSKKTATKAAKADLAAIKRSVANKATSKEKTPLSDASEENKDNKQAAAKATAKTTTTTTEKVAAEKTASKKVASKKAVAKKSASAETAVETSKTTKKSASKTAAAPSAKTATKKVSDSAATPKTTKKTASKKVPAINTKTTSVDTAATHDPDYDDDMEMDLPVSSQAAVVPYERDSSHYMDTKQLEHFSEKLAAWKQQLMEEVDRTVGHMKDDATNFPDPNDRATQEEEFSLELRTRDRERKLIKKINEAQKRIDDDDYGYCETCGIEIGVNRLEARPTAELCIDCKTLEEIRERQTA